MLPENPILDEAGNPYTVPVAVDNTPDNASNSNQCSYRDAAVNDGWGWDPVRLKACPPQCIDTDGDGWGWDGVKSCELPTHNQCIDYDGDGWGWDGKRSCRI